MPRSARISAGGYIYHVINRGNGRARVFHDEGDYASFATLMTRAGDRTPMRILAYCLMPNHFHLVLWPREDGDMGDWMRWLLTTHASWHHKKYETSGHIWQGRYKSFMTQDDGHLYTLLRYVERNPVRANLVDSAREWRWSSASRLTADVPLEPWPIERPGNWHRRLDRPETSRELDTLRNCVNRETALGSDQWITRTEISVGGSLRPRPRGRPSKKKNK